MGLSSFSGVHLPQHHLQQHTVTVRLSESELAALMSRAERENRTRSDAIRVTLAEWAHPAV
ncbi:ribbon-helix-helix protein, CopG family [Mycetocola saprophilus]|uniref:ribbon-helix-helix protein, CopG family n=1 Tax=Mycetocola saprophilus TaxID=76636 RepID=UPI003BF25598